MTYRTTSKARKLWSKNSHAKKERLRMENGEPRQLIEDDSIVIDIKRKLTGEHAVFELTPGDRCDNYRVYCNERFLGVMGITKVCEGIRKALPRMLSEFALD